MDLVSLSLTCPQHQDWIACLLWGLMKQWSIVVLYTIQSWMTNRCIQKLLYNELQGKVDYAKGGSMEDDKTIMRFIDGANLFHATKIEPGDVA